MSDLFPNPIRAKGSHCGMQSYTDCWLDRPSHMQHLYSVCQTKTKIWKAIPDGTHNNTVAEPHYFQYIAEFIREQVLKDS